MKELEKLGRKLHCWILGKENYFSDHSLARPKAGWKPDKRRLHLSRQKVDRVWTVISVVGPIRKEQILVILESWKQGKWIAGEDSKET